MKDIVNKNIEEWSKYPFCEQTQKEINILAKDKSKLHDAFYKNLEFGTGGMRGLMGVGTNRINKYTIGKNTQGISNYLNKNINGKKSAVIAYDCRHNSVELARTVAEVFSANDIKVFLFSHLRPTPELSYAVRKLNCSCGIVLTASHNPPEYNGFKVYWQDGGQIVPPIDNLLINEIEQVNFNDINFNFKEELIEIIDTKIDNLFIDVCLKNGLNSDLKNRSSKIIFTALHGTSSTIISKLLKRAGYENAKYVESQMAPDANFSTVESPNPEEVESLDLALKLAEDENAEMIIGTDPDADRLGVAVRDLNNNLALINGNQLMVLMFDYILKRINFDIPRVFIENFHDVINLRHAEKALEVGVDGLILVASGAGGHAGTLNPFALVTEVRKMYSGPVVLAGSITNGSQILAAQVMGADFVYMGTKFICSAECPAPEDYKDMIIRSSANDIVYTNFFTGIYGSYLKESADKAGYNSNKLFSWPRFKLGLQLFLGRKLKQVNFSSFEKLGSKAWKDIWSAGQGVGDIDQKQRTAEIVSQLIEEYSRAKEKIMNLL